MSAYQAYLDNLCSDAFIYDVNLASVGHFEYNPDVIPGTKDGVSVYLENGTENLYRGHEDKAMLELVTTNGFNEAARAAAHNTLTLARCDVDVASVKRKPFNISDFPSL